MNDIEKKIEELKSEFSGKLEALRKEAEAQKKQEEWKPWKPETEEKYFFVDNDLTLIGALKSEEIVSIKLIPPLKSTSPITMSKDTIPVG